MTWTRAISNNWCYISKRDTNIPQVCHHFGTGNDVVMIIRDMRSASYVSFSFPQTLYDDRVKE